MTGAGEGGDDAASLRFDYHRAVAPMVWMLVACGTIELIVTHVLLAFWFPTAALILSLLTLAGLGWLVRGLLLMKHRPVLLGGGRLVMRTGSIGCVDIPLDAIAGIRPSIDGVAMKRRSVINLAMLAYPNVVVDLIAPLPGRKGITTIAHRLDDPAAFVSALERLRASA